MMLLRSFPTKGILGSRYHLSLFIGDIKVKKFKELLTSDDGGVAVVVAWFVSVAEGVDCWFPDVNVKSKLRCVDELEWDPFL
ncbi:hypothetical protein QL285_002769 [Trifolium repens]|nr:hypothetical protein QL285_079271 [Trifolium repens]KAK2455302.1 hypothetical protein QL285_002769 [Trifolium repens]